METIDEVLEHFGIKGMRWGVRNAAKQTARADKKWEKKIVSPQSFVKIHNAAADEMNSVHISRINNMPKYKNVNFNDPKNKALNDQYMNEYAKTWNSVLAKHSQAIAGTSPSGKRFVLSQDPHTGNFMGQVIEKTTKHAANSPTVIFVTDNTGHVTEVKIDEMTQTAILGEDALEHFGIKGMHWGVRRNRDTGGGGSKPKRSGPSVDAARAQKITKKVKSRGVHSLSNAELKQINERINLEQQYTRLTGESGDPRGLAISKKALSFGGKFAAQVLTGVGQEQAKAILNQQASKQLIKAGLLVAKGGK